MARGSKMRRRGGFTLFEVLLAMTVLAIGVVSTLHVLSASNSQKRQTNVESMAVVLAQEKMERLKSASFADIQSEVEDYESIEGYSGYRRTTTVALDPGSALKAVTITVEAKAGGAPYEIATLIRR